MKSATSARVLAMALLAGGMGGALTSLAARPDFSQYQVILTRQPFGAVSVAAKPPGPDPTIPGPNAFTQNLRMCAITDTGAGVRVGLVDVQAKKTYFLYVGDAEDGIELVEADYAAERALLRKGSESYWMAMGTGAPAGGGAGGGVATASVGAPAGSSARRLSYVERVRQRREAEQQRMKELAERPVLTPEALERSIQEHQMEVIRRGEPPLPIPLTPEMDDQLVAEGVLPPLP